MLKMATNVLIVIAVLSSMCLQGYADTGMVEQEMTSRASIVQDNSDLIKNEIQGENIRYDYTIGESAEDGSCEVALNFTLPENPSNEISVVGTVEQITDSAGKDFLMGPLEGQTTINSRQYDVLVGVTKDLSNGKLNAGVTLANPNEELIMFSFGDKIDRAIEPTTDESTGPVPRSFLSYGSATAGISGVSAGV